MRRLLAAGIALSVALAGGVVAAGALAPTARPPAVVARASSEMSPNRSVIAGAASPPASPVASPSSSPVPPVTGAPDVEPGVSAAALDSLVARFVAQSHTPGISVTIRWADGQTWTGVAGYADVAHRVPVRADTAFAAASMSKTFTAALILELVAERRLGLSDPAARWLDPAVAKAARLTPDVTVRMLLDHTSGLYDFFFGRGVDAALQAAPGKRWSTLDALRFVRAPYFKPGTGWHYSNTNYVLLGLIAERITGTSLAETLRARFFGPLGLRDTWYQVAEKARAPTAHGYRLVGTGKATRAVDLSTGGGVMPFTSVVTAADGAGSIATTSRDLATWAAALYGGQVLDTASFAAMVGDVAMTAPYDPRLPYGLGLQSVRIARFDTLGHSGRLLGFRGVLRYVPAYGVAIAIMTNQSRTDVAPLAAQLLSAAIPPVGPCAACR